MGLLRVASKKGDDAIAWPDTEAERETDEGRDATLVARKQFYELMSKNFFAYTINEPGAPGEQVKQFDPAAREIVVMPPLAGGSD